MVGDIHTLSPAQIDNACITIRDNVCKLAPQYTAHINILYLYGCRIGELFGNAISYDAGRDKVLIIPQKKNNTRVLPRYNERVPQWIETINLTYENTWLNKRNLQRIIAEANPYRALKCGNKNIGAHLFRHNWIKKQVQQGKQFTSVDRDLGYTDQTIADTYAVSKITY